MGIKQLGSPDPAYENKFLRAQPFDSTGLVGSTFVLEPQGHTACGGVISDYSVPTGAIYSCLLYTSPSPRDKRQSRMPSSA